MFSIVSLFILPWGLALFFVGNLSRVYGAVAPRAVAAYISARRRLGRGADTLRTFHGPAWDGSRLRHHYWAWFVRRHLVPLFFNNHAVLGTSRGALILSGLAIMVAGIAVSAQAGWQRDDGQKTETGTGYTLALLWLSSAGLWLP